MSGVPWWATPGRKVACVQTSGRQGTYGELVPTVGQVLTIREVVEIDAVHSGIRFEEIVNTANTYRCGYMEAFFAFEAFKPLVEDSEEDGIEARLFHAKGLKHHIKSPSPVEGETA